MGCYMRTDPEHHNTGTTTPSEHNLLLDCANNIVKNGPDLVGDKRPNFSRINGLIYEN